MLSDALLMCDFDLINNFWGGNEFYKYYFAYYSDVIFIVGLC
jgi:hypothetical protein